MQFHIRCPWGSPRVWVEHASWQKTISLWERWTFIYMHIMMPCHMQFLFVNCLGRLEKTLSHVSTGEHRSAPGCLFRHGHFHTIKTLTCLCSPPSNSICQTRTLIRSSKTVIAQCLGLQILVLQELYLDVLLKAGLAKRKNISRTCIYWNVWEMRSWTTTLRHHSILISIRFYL